MDAVDAEFVSEPQRSSNSNPQNQSDMVDTQALAIRDQSAIARPLSVKDIVDQVHLIQEVMRSVMIEDTHFGCIPGTGTKKVLLQPGAQKLTMTFRLAPEYVIQETNFERDHKEYRVVCTLKSIQSGNFVGQGVGCCSTLESKYRYRGGSRKCPKCGKDTIIKGKTEYGGGWICFQKKGGCGAKWPDGAAEIESQSIEKQENDNPADCYNTVLKMAKKRAFVDATITATAASDIFTQDIADPEEEHHEAPKAAPAKLVAPAPKPTPPAQPPRTIPKRDAPISTEATRKWMMEQLRAELGDNLELAWNYFYSKGMITPDETLDKLPLEFVPTSKALMAEMITLIKAKAKADDDHIPGVEVQEPEMQEPASEAAPDDVNAPNAAWRSFPLPFNGVKKDKDKNPIGTFAKGTPIAELPKDYLWGLWKHTKVNTEFNGRPLSESQIQSNREWRAALDSCGAHYKFT